MVNTGELLCKILKKRCKASSALTILIPELPTHLTTSKELWRRFPKDRFYLSKMIPIIQFAVRVPSSEKVMIFK